jgi:hypothetical protein
MEHCLVLKAWGDCFCQQKRLIQNVVGSAMSLGIKFLDNILSRELLNTKSQLREAPAHDQKYALEAIQMVKVTERLKSHKIFIQTNASPHWCEELEGFQDVYSSQTSGRKQVSLQSVRKFRYEQ